MKMRFTQTNSLLPALNSRNYRLFAIGECISLIGTWMTQIATLWLVYHFTKSSLMLGLVGFANQIPNFFVAPLGGVIIDHFSRRHTLIITQQLAMIQSLMLAILALTGIIQVWHIIALSLFQGFINAIDVPARQAFIPELVEHREDLSSAIAINSIMFNCALFIGPAIGGLLIVRIGAAYCFLIDGLSYIAVIITLVVMKIKNKEVSVISGSPLQRVKDGFTYTFGFPSIRAILSLSALVSLMGMQYTVLEPIFAEEILKGGAQTLGFLMAASGVGALLGSIYLATWRTELGIEKLIALAPVILGIGLIIFSLSHFLPLSLLMMMIISLGVLLLIATSNIVLQMIVDDDKRGRVMSFFAMSILGVLPFGNLLGGALARYIGAPNTLIIAGIACILGAIFFVVKYLSALTQILHQINEKNKI